MKKLLHDICFILHSARLLPHYCVLRYKCYRKDIETLKYIEDTRYFTKEGGFFRILYKRPEYVSVLYARLQYAGKILSLFGPKYPFKMSTKIIGGDLYRPSPLYAFECGKDWQGLQDQTQCDCRQQPGRYPHHRRQRFCRGRRGCRW